VYSFLIMTEIGSSDVLVFMNIDIEDGRTARIEIRRGDSPAVLARKFCEEHYLPDEAIPLLTESIESSMQDAVSPCEPKNNHHMPPSGARAPTENVGNEDLLQSPCSDRPGNIDLHEAKGAENYFSDTVQVRSSSSAVKSASHYERSKAALHNSSHMSSSFAESLQRLLEPIGRVRKRNGMLSRSLSTNDLTCTNPSSKEAAKAKPRKSEDGSGKAFVWERLYRQGTQGKTGRRSLRSKSATWNTEASTRR
jgi:hypothetical protein